MLLTAPHVCPCLFVAKQSGSAPDNQTHQKQAALKQARRYCSTLQKAPMWRAATAQGARCSVFHPCRLSGGNRPLAGVRGDVQVAGVHVQVRCRGQELAAARRLERHRQLLQGRLLHAGGRLPTRHHLRGLLHALRVRRKLVLERGGRQRDHPASHACAKQPRQVSVTGRNDRGFTALQEDLV